MMSRVALLEAGLISKLYTLLRLLKAPVEEEVFTVRASRGGNKNEVDPVTSSGTLPLSHASVDRSQT